MSASIREYPVKTHLPQEYRDGAAPGLLSKCLGAFSVGLGLAEMLAPATVAARTGVPYRGLIRAYGAREFVAGIGILTTRAPAAWLWGRVAGDLVDLATLAVSHKQVGESGRRRAVETAVAVAGVATLDLVAALSNSRCTHTK